MVCRAAAALALAVLPLAVLGTEAADDGDVAAALVEDEGCEAGAACEVQLLQRHARQKQHSAGKGLVPALVHEVYTFGAPATHKHFALRNEASASGCFPGLRSYTLDRTGVDKTITQVDAAAIFQSAGGYVHPYMTTVELHWQEDSKYYPCVDASSEQDGKPRLPQNGPQIYQEWRLHQENDYKDRLKKITLDGVDVSARTPFSTAAKFTLPAWANYDETSSFRGRIAYDLPGWHLVGYAQYQDGSDTDTLSVIQEDSSMDCAVVFEGTNSFLEMGTSILQYGTGYCGYTDIHVGYRNELWTLTGDRWQELKPKLQSCNRMLCIGHSLGGSLCELFAACANSGHVDDPDYQRLAWSVGHARRMQEA